MNINGCLVHRTSDIIKFIRPDLPQDDLEDKFKRFVVCFKHKKNWHYFRDGYMLFLRRLMLHPRVKFAFYSSIMRQNIFPIIQKMFANEMGLMNERMDAIFDRNFVKEAPELTGEPYGTIRDLPKVWESEKLKG